MSFPAAFALIAIGILAIYVELFVPAFGLIGIAGVVAIIATVVAGYQYLPDHQATIILITALVVTPTTLVLALRRLPRSILGRRLILGTQLSPSPPSQRHSDGTEPVALNGRTGVAATPLHPSGIATIEGTRYSVVTNGEYIDAGKSVIVTQHFGSRIVVRCAPPDSESTSQ
jgi:membrane-bound serine protease (ClpP class)